MIERGTGWVGKSNIDGVEATTRRLQDLAAMLSALPRSTIEPLRQVCAQVLASSHALDDDPLLASAIEGALYILQPGVADRDEVWRAYNVLARVPDESARWYGRLDLTLASGTGWSNHVMQDHGFASALLEDSLNDANVAGNPLAVLSIENPATWQALKGRLPSGLVCVLTDGMPNRPTQLLLRKLAAKARGLHWGDIDTDGMRVLRYLQSLGAVTPVLMDRDALHCYQNVLVRDGKPLGQDDAVLSEAWRLGGWLEQERIPLDEAIAAIREALAPNATTPRA